MELIFNDLSIHGQFPNLTAFKDAVGHIMIIQGIAHKFGVELYCHRNVANAQVTYDSTMREAAPRALDKDKLRAFMGWLNRHGPFWEDIREHQSNDWFEYDGDVVTDTAVGEAAHCLFHGIDRALVSMNPSSWLTSPLSVLWRENGLVGSTNVANYWDANELEASLAAAPPPLGSWKDLEMVARTRYPELTFSSHSFDPLHGHPFGKGPAERLLTRLAVLHDLKHSFDERGRFTPEGQALYQKHFFGEKAWFSDSSDTEKAAFRLDLTFPHPTNAGESLFCTWHGKVKTPQLRIHFSWPIQAREPLYITYVGPKITKT